MQHAFAVKPAPHIPSSQTRLGDHRLLETAFTRSLVCTRYRMAEEGRLLAGAGEPIRPPRLEDAGLEDCALPPESIAEAFSLAAKAVSSRLAHLPLSDDEGADPLVPRGGCVDDAGPTCGTIPDAILGAGGGSDGGADVVVVVGGGGAGGGGDEVVVGGLGDEEDRVVVVGEEQEGKLGREKGCVEGIREGVDELGRGEGNGGEGEEEAEVVSVEKQILVEDFA